MTVNSSPPRRATSGDKRLLRRGRPRPPGRGRRPAGGAPPAGGAGRPPRGPGVSLIRLKWSRSMKNAATSLPFRRACVQRPAPAAPYRKAGWAARSGCRSTPAIAPAPASARWPERRRPGRPAAGPAPARSAPAVGADRSPERQDADQLALEPERQHQSERGSSRSERVEVGREAGRSRRSSSMQLRTVEQVLHILRAELDPGGVAAARRSSRSTTPLSDLPPSGATRVTPTRWQGKTSRIRASRVSTIEAASVADSTARSISAAVESAWNCRPSCDGHGVERRGQLLELVPAGDGRPGCRSPAGRCGGSPRCSSTSGTRLRWI